MYQRMACIADTDVCAQIACEPISCMRYRCTCGCVSEQCFWHLLTFSVLSEVHNADGYTWCMLEHA